jgi:hypothetical protein
VYLGGRRIEAYLIGLEACLPVYNDLEEALCVMQFDGCKFSTVPVRIVAFTKGQRVWIRVRPNVLGSIVQETADRASVPFVLVYEQY